MKSHRPERVGSIIRQVVSEAIASKLSDPRVSPLSSVTKVQVTPDLEHAKVWISVIGDEGVQKLSMAGLQSARGLLQKLVAQELPIRQCPHLSFHLDVSIKKAAETIRLINEAMDEIHAREAERAAQADGQAPSDGQGTDGESETTDDPV